MPFKCLLQQVSMPQISVDEDILMATLVGMVFVALQPSSVVRTNVSHSSGLGLLISFSLGDEKVKRPSCSTTQSLPRVVGYYEGWSTQRPCDGFYPEQIPMGIYTHLIYAFASINPQTFEVVPATRDDVLLYSRITALKNKDPDLHVNIGIGGWSFNDPGPTATTFSDLVGSEDNQRIFFKSLISFMATYNFDGVDIDWEYPAADDRSGRPEDFANFPKFMSNLKVALTSTGGRDELSMTLPTSYWYLQHFDIKNLEPSVDFFNYMAYDLHGTWDKGNKTSDQPKL
jgi:GH18 family chitinase